MSHLMNNFFSPVSFERLLIPMRRSMFDFTDFYDIRPRSVRRSPYLSIMDDLERTLDNIYVDPKPMRNHYNSQEYSITGKIGPDGKLVKTSEFNYEKKMKTDAKGNLISDEKQHFKDHDTGKMQFIRERKLNDKVFKEIKERKDNESELKSK